MIHVPAIWGGTLWIQQQNITTAHEVEVDAGSQSEDPQSGRQQHHGQRTAPVADDMLNMGGDVTDNIQSKPGPED